MVKRFEKAMALDTLAITKGQAAGKIPAESTPTSEDIRRAIANARTQGANYPELKEAARRGLAGRPNPSLN